MDWNIVILIIAVIFLAIYLRKKQFKMAVPYLGLILITPVYSLLDQNIFVKVFGCGCVPSAQTNMLGIAFNANDLRVVVYSIMTVLMGILGAIFAKKLNSKKEQIIYLITIIVFNSLLTYEICKFMLWG